MTPQEEQLLDYIQNVYPRGIRQLANEPDSLVWKYDYVRAFLISYIKDLVQSWVNELLVQTSDLNGVEEREKFLQIPVDISLSLEARKARIMVRLAGNPATIQNLKNVIKSFTAWWDETYKLIELWKETPFDIDDTWSYMVDLYNPSPILRVSELVSLLNQVHPAHCQLIMAFTYPVKDAIWLHSNLDHSNNTEFIRWEDLVSRPTDRLWFGWNYIWWGYRS